jgi:hypothetical protein
MLDGSEDGRFPDLLSLDRAFSRLRGWVKSASVNLGKKSALKKVLAGYLADFTAGHKDIRAALEVYAYFRRKGFEKEPRSVQRTWKAWEKTAASDPRLAEILELRTERAQALEEFRRLETESRALSRSAPPANAEEAERRQARQKQIEGTSFAEADRGNLLRGLAEGGPFPEDARTGPPNDGPRPADLHPEL